MDLMDKECPDTDRGIGCTGRMRTSGVGMSDRGGRCTQAVPVEDGRRASGEIASVETLFEEGDERRQEGLRLGAGRQVEMADQAVLFDGGVAARSGAFGPRKRVVGVHVERLGFELTRAMDFLPSTAFISDDLPTFDRPQKHISGKSELSNCLAVANAFSKTALL